MMSKQRVKGDMQFKREAMHRSLRRQQLHAYFNTVREQLVLDEQHHNAAIEYAHSLIDSLPSTILKLMQALEENLQPTSEAIVMRVDQMADRMVRVEIFQWANYACVLARVLVSKLTPMDYQRVVKHSLLGVLECADVLYQRKDNQYLRQQILLQTLEYLYHSGKYLAKCDGLQQTALFQAVSRLWQAEIIKEERFKLVSICNCVLSARFDQEQAENISPQLEIDLQIMKKRFIQEVFYGKVNNAKIIVRWCLQSFLVEQSQSTLEIGLKVLINITLYVQDKRYYCPLLQAYILHLFNSIILHQPSVEATIYSLRLLNNMLVNDVNITKAILKEIHMPSLLGLERICPSIREEVVEMLINIMHFLNDDEEQIRELVMKGAHLLILDFIPQLIGKNDEDDQKILATSLNAIIIAYTHHSIELWKDLNERIPMLERLTEEDAVYADIARELLRMLDARKEYV